MSATIGDITANIKLKRDTLQSDLAAAQSSISNFVARSSEKPIEIKAGLAPTVGDEIRRQVIVEVGKGQQVATQYPITVPMKAGPVEGVRESIGDAQNEASSGGGGGGRGGYNPTRGLGRMLAAYTLMREGSRLISGYGEYAGEMEASTQGNLHGGIDVEAQLKAQKKWNQTLASGPLGFAAGLVAEPLSMLWSKNGNTAARDITESEESTRKNEEKTHLMEERFQSERHDLEYTKRQTRMAGEVGASSDDRFLMRQKDERDALADTIAKQRMDEKLKGLKESPGEKAIRDGMIASLANKQAFEQSKFSVDQSRENQATSAEISELKLRAGGDTQGAERAAFIQKQQEQLDAYREKHGDAAAGDYQRSYQSGALEEFDKKQAAEKIATANEAARKISDIQAEAAEAGLRAEGHAYEASAAAFKRSVSDKVAALRDAANLTTDATKKSQLNSEADAEEKAGQQEADARAKEHDRKIADRRADLQDETEAANLRSVRRKNEADDLDFARERRHALEEAANEGVGVYNDTTAEYDAKQNQRIAERKHQSDEAVEDINLRTYQANAGAAGQGKLGQEEAIRESVIKQIREAEGDPAKQAALRQEGIARFNQFLAGDRQPSRVIDPAQFANELQTTILNNAGGGGAAADAKARQDKADLQAGKQMTSDLNDAGKAMQKAADMLLQSKPLYTVGAVF